MRIAVTGCNGQAVRALLETAGPKFEILTVGRPALDLARPETIFPALAALRPDLIINAAAYTAVDRAEKEMKLAFMVNGFGPALVASSAETLGVPLIHLSTDYIFDGKKATAYTEEDEALPAKTINVYGATKLAGERAVAEATTNYAIVRTSWLYAPYGKNFVRTMVGLADKEEVRVVDDQVGCPTYAPDLARALLCIASALLDYPEEADYRGIFHFCGSGETSWAGFAEEIFTLLAKAGRKVPRVLRVSSAEYPTPARRPANSTLDTWLFEHTFGMAISHWVDSLARCLDRLKDGEMTV
jgi:dTDP-4-dehydrorhamnose reductase